MKRIIQRMTGDGMLLAIYIVLATLTVKLTPNLQISFSGIAVIMAAVLFGLPDALFVAFFGSFIGQLTGPYGLMITTPIWMTPPILRALVFGIVYELYLKRSIKLEDKRILFIVYAIVAGLVTTIANTGAIFLDAKIIGYPVSLAVVEGVFRIVSSIASSIFIAFVCLPIIYALKNSGLIYNRVKTTNQPKEIEANKNTN